MKTKVIFRKWPKGEVIALFPATAGTMDPFTCQSYQNVGQHGAASVHLVHDTLPATPSEFRPLARELRRIGYRLQIVRRFTRHDLESRKKQIAQFAAGIETPAAVG